MGRYQMKIQDIKVIGTVLYIGESISFLWQHKEIMLTHSAGIDTVRLSPLRFAQDCLT